MIPQAFIDGWAQVVPWPDPNQIEQDLALSRLIVEIATHPALSNELVFRGGTCLHKLHLPSPLRYSDDLDYVRASHSPIGPIFDAIRDVAAGLGMQARTEIGRFPKILLRAPFESGMGRMRITVEMNTYETSPAHPYLRLPFTVESPWWTGSTEVLTFEPAELIATKLRALYQRSKGRDLFDLWLAVTQVGIAPADIVGCFQPYRPYGYTRELAERNLRAKLADPSFTNDLTPLISVWPNGYDIEAAAETVIAEVFPFL